MIIYLHGFSSAGLGPKVDMLREKFGDSNVIAPTLPFDPDKVRLMVETLVNKFLETRSDNDKLIFVGTSLGAFYANYFGNLYDCPMVLINPSVFPNKTLMSHLGYNKNYVTGDEFFVSIAHLTELEKMANHANENYSGILVNLFLAEDDDIIPYEVALTMFKYTSYKLITPDGGHRFTKHWDKVIDRIDYLLNN